jgi:hypothetical protein
LAKKKGWSQILAEPEEGAKKASQKLEAINRRERFSKKD